MEVMSGNKGYLAILVTVLVMMTASCSTTRRLGENETLYNGMSIKVTPVEDEKVPAGVGSDLTKAVDVRPNNPWPWLRPYKRMPFPLGLWVYNNWNDSCKGIKKWLYNKWVAQPVLISDVRPDTRVKMLKTILNNNGYFAGKASFEVDYNKKNPKKANIKYNVCLLYTSPIPRDS